MSNDSQNYQHDRDSFKTIPKNSTAVVSLVAGILGLTFLPLIGSVVALITGSIAKKEIAGSDNNLGGEELARVGMILGWIGVGLTAIVLCLVGVMFLLAYGAWWLWNNGDQLFGLATNFLLLFI